MPINLTAFSNAAESVPGNRVLTLSGGEVRSTGRVGTFFTSRAANRATLSAFVNSVRQRYGDHVANMLDNTRVLADMKAAGKPLTARMAKDLIRLAEMEETRVNNANAKTVERFLSDTGASGKSLDAALDRFCEKHGIPDENRALLKEKVTNYLVQKTAHGGFDHTVLTEEALFENVAQGIKGFAADYNLNQAGELLGSKGAKYPGSAADKLQILELGLTEGKSDHTSVRRALHELPHMRELQTDGAPLTKETVWRALFNEELPANVTSGEVSLGKAAAEKHGAERAALAQVTGRSEADLAAMEKRLPWGRIVALARQPDTLSLDGGVRGIENGINPKGNLSAAEESLRSDPARADRADGAKQVCGDGAQDAQVANVMLCLGKNALVPVREAAALVGASIDFDDPAAISVTLTKQNDGTVRVEIQSQEALREEKGHFRMVLDVKPDGEMTAKEFQVSPNAATLNDRNIEERSRRNELTAATAAPMLATGDEPGGLGKAVRDRAETLSPGVKLDAGVLDVFSSQIRDAMFALTIIPLCSEEEYAKQLAILPAPARDLAQALHDRGGLPTLDELRQVRNGMVDAFFSDLKAGAQEMPDNQRAQFTRTCLEHMSVPPASVCAATAQLAGTFTQTLGWIAAARDANEVSQLMENLNTVIDTVTRSALQAANAERSESGQSPLGENEARALQSTALRMALNTLADQMGGGKLGMICLADALGRECSPFSDMLYDLAHEEPEPNPNLFQLCSLIQAEIMDLVPPEAAARFDPGEIRERNLSLARQRQILGEGQFITRGAHTEIERLNEPISLNEILHRDMHAIREYVCAEAEKEIRGHLPTDVEDPKDPSWSMRTGFFTDIRRNGIIVNDRFLPPGKTDAENEAAFFKQFPDRRSAAVLSTIAYQVLPGILLEALGRVPGRQNAPQGLGAAQITREGDVLKGAMMGDPGLFGGGSPQSIRIDSLGGNRYRVSHAQAKIGGDNGFVSPNGLERSLTEVSIDVVINDPPALPTVENAQVDLLLRGHAAMSGETLPPAAPPPSGTVLRPPARPT